MNDQLTSDEQNHSGLSRQLEPLVKPHRIQLRRAKGWRMPENTVKVDRSTPWGNPFVVGKHGTQTECVQMFTYLVCHGLFCATTDMECCDKQMEYIRHINAHKSEIWGKNLACWCKDGTPCHADILLKIVNGAA